MINVLSALLAPTVLAYLLGSIPSGLILGKLAGVGDIRKIGSGNIGATNMMRTGKRGLALLTLLLDAAKGYAAVVICSKIATHYTGIQSNGYLYGLYAIAGHIWPIWLKFKGGKGVATTLGVYYAVDPLIGTVTCALWLAVFLITRFSSLAAILSIGVSPILALFVEPYFCMIALVIALVVILKHKDNIRRLISGTETKWSKQKNDPS
jgi:glycerol-3-phosphate acyltransferase PlsY